MSESDNRTATQRIEDLENVMTHLYTGGMSHKESIERLIPMVESVQSDIALIKEALKLLNKKTEAIVVLAKPETGINAESVNNLVTQMNVEDLKAQVEAFIKTGHLVPADTVAENSYIVCEEIDRDGKVTNPRAQFRISSQNKEIAGLLLGKKVGDQVAFGNDRLDARVLEIYSLQEPKAPEAQALAQEQAPAPEAAPVQQLDPLPPETPVQQFVSDAGSVVQPQASS